jgi:VanZ family protein
MKHLSFVRFYPLSSLCILLIWVLSLTPFFPETPLDNVDFIDKYTHFIMYGGTCAVIWWEHLRHCRKEARRQGRQGALRPNLRALTVAMLCMVLLGGLMELLQAYCTTTRSGEWLDFWADSIGVLLGTAIGLLLLLYYKNRD